MIFADKLIRLRKKSGMSQEEFAEKMNVSRQAVSKWESAQSIPDLERILKSMFSISKCADCAADFSADDGNFSQTYFMYFKKNFLSMTENMPARCVLRDTKQALRSPIYSALQRTIFSRTISRTRNSQPLIFPKKQ